LKEIVIPPFRGQGVKGIRILKRIPILDVQVDVKSKNE